MQQSPYPGRLCNSSNLWKTAWGPEETVTPQKLNKMAFFPAISSEPEWKELWFVLPLSPTGMCFLCCCRLVLLMQEWETFTSVQTHRGGPPTHPAGSGCTQIRDKVTLPLCQHANMLKSQVSWFCLEFFHWWPFDLFMMFNVKNKISPQMFVVFGLIPSANTDFIYWNIPLWLLNAYCNILCLSLKSTRRVDLD